MDFTTPNNGRLYTCDRRGCHAVLNLVPADAPAALERHTARGEQYEPTGTDWVVGGRQAAEWVDLCPEHYREWLRAIHLYYRSPFLAARRSSRQLDAGSVQRLVERAS